MYRPKHRTQLWRPGTGSVDCGPRSWQHAMDAATRGGIMPSIDRIRTWGAVPGPQTTNAWDADLAFERAKPTALRYARKTTAPWDVAVAALRAGKGVHLCIAYGVLNDLQPGRTGDPAFRGGHSIYVQELRRTRAGRRVTLSFDSLYDGRRPGISDGPQWVRLSTLRRAAQAFAGRPGRWIGGVIPMGQSTGGPGIELVDPDDVSGPVDSDATAAQGVALPPWSTGEDLDAEPPGADDYTWDDDPDDDDLDVLPDDDVDD